MKFNLHLQSLPWALICVFLIITAGILLTGHLYYQSEEKKIIIEKQNELSAIADLKVGQIDQWLNERLGDARIIFKNDLLIHQIESFFRAPDEIKRKQELLMWMNSLRESYSYSDVSLIAPSGAVKLSVTTKTNYLGTHLLENIKEVIKHREIFISDLHKSEIDTNIHLDILVPLILPDRRDNALIGIVLLRIDPYKLLFPLIQSWPTPSRTSETLLLRREGDSVLFLNELRHRKNTALTLRLPVSQEQLPAAMAARGVEDTVAGIDYRGIPVFASIKKIPHSPWFMVAKVDQEEIYTPFHKQMTLVMLVTVLIILVVASTLGILWRHQRMNYYRRQYQLEVQRQALISHFDYLFKYANDIIFLADKDLNIIEANDRALETYGCTRDELFGLNVARLRAPQTAPQLPERIRLLDDVKTATYETVHQRKDGSTFPVEISARVIEIEGKKFYQSIGRDITERKRAEEALHESEEKFRAIFENNSAAIAIIEPDTTISMVNKAYCQMSGYTKQEVLGMSWTQQIPPGDLERLQEYNRRRMINPKDAPDKYEFTFKHKNGEIRYGLISVALIQRSGKIAASFIDITERKRTEKALKESEETYRTIFENTGTANILIEEDTTISLANKEFENLSGYSKQEIEGKKKWMEFVVQEDVDRMLSQHQLRRKEPGAALKHYEFRFIDRSKKIHIIYLTNELIVGTNRSIASLLDITDRKRAEEAILESEEKFRNLFEHSPVGKSITGLDGYFHVNKSFCDILGYSEDELKAKKWMDITHPEDIQLTSDFMQSLIDGKESQTRFEKRYIHKNGTIVWTDLSSYLQRDQEGKPQFFITTMTDITERKRAEEEIYNSRQMLQLVLDHIPQRVFWKDRNYAYLGCNKTFAQDAGLEYPEQIIGKNDYQLSWKETAALYRADDKYVMENDIIKLDYEEPQDKPDGTKMWLRTSKVPLHDRDGNVFGVLGTYEDITERKRVEEKLRENEERYRTLFENAQIGIYRTTSDGKILAANPALIQMLGYTSIHELAARNLELEGFAPASSGRLFKEKVERDGEIREWENVWVKRDSSTILVSENARAIRGEDGKVLYYEGTIVDITERKQVEEKIRQLNEELEQRVKDRTAQLEAANKELESFSYSVSHDLRAPLRGIDGWSLALVEDFHDQLNEQARQNLDRIRTETQRMGQLIDDLLKISRVTRSEMEPTSVDLTALANSIVARMQKSTADRNIHFMIEPGLSACCDNNLVEIVLTNLFENACKFTSKCERAQIEFGKTDINGTSAFFIRDNGVGFNMQYAQNLFGAFWRMHKPSEFPGTGIGLATVQRIIHRHGGRVWADARVNGGATFYFTLKEKA